MLTAIGIDTKATPRQVWFVLNKDGIKLDDKITSQGEVFTYSMENLAGEYRVPIFVTYIESVFAGDCDTNIVQLKYTMVISTNVTIIKSGDRFGIFEVDTEQPLSLTNYIPISLLKDSTINLIGNMKFKVANSKDNDVRFYPKIDYQIQR